MFGKMYELFFGGKEPKSLLQPGKYTINDPSTPDLTSGIVVPTPGALRYTVAEMSARPANPNQLRALNCHITMGNCINKVQTKLPTPLSKWASTNTLQIFPAAGRDMNAYYDRRSLKFFFYDHRGRRVFFSESSDIVAHELGHAILDSMRPDFWSVQALEIWSFHEGFSDIVAMFNLMNYDSALQKAISETGGDLSKSNAVSRLAEEVGVLIKNVTGDPTHLPNALRDPSVEKFNYVNPSTLPADAPNNALAAECHSFGRVFSSAWYEIFVRIYNHHRSLPGASPLAAAKVARDEAFSIMTKAIPSSARVSGYYASIANSMLNVAKTKPAMYRQILSDVFDERNILKKGSIKMLSSISFEDVAKKAYSIEKIGKLKVVNVREQKTFKLSDLSVVSAMSENGDVEIEVPFDSCYEFDGKGRLVNEIKSDEISAKADAEACVLSIGNHLGDEQMWKVDEGKLVRNFIS